MDNHFGSLTGRGALLILVSGGGFPNEALVCFHNDGVRSGGGRTAGYTIRYVPKGRLANFAKKLSDRHVRGSRAVLVDELR